MDQQRLSSMKIKLVSVEPDTPLVEAVRLMHGKGISCLVVCRGETPVGILTERDVSRLTAKTGAIPDGYAARDVMSAGVVTASEDEDIFAAYSTMCEKGIRHLAVLDAAGRAVGVITLTDLLHRLGIEHLSEIRTVAEVMTKDVLAVSPTDTVREALHLIAEAPVSCVVVADASGVRGILTERDVIRLAAEGKNLDALTAAEAMSSPILSVAPETYAFQAVMRMEEKGVRRLAVVDGSGLLVGLITQSDLVAALIQKYAGLEFMVRARTRQLAKKNDELEYSNQQLRHLDEMKSAFLSSVSHELRTPLTSMLGFAKIIKRDYVSVAPAISGDVRQTKRSERIGKNLDILISEGERMARLINDFLDLTKIESGQVEWRDQSINAGDFILHACHAANSLFEGRRGVTLRTRIKDDLPQICIDADRLLQVMVNLIGNAAKFTDKGHVAVEAANIDNEYVEIRVEDTGVGIAAAELPKVFDKFYQVEKRQMANASEGTGLGLSICKEIVEHYGGRIWVESELGRGTTIKFRIPADREIESLPIPRPVFEGGDLAGRNKPLILAVDDNPGIREYLRQLFTDEGFQVASASNGWDALRAAEELLPDCVVMDLMMPGMDGSEAIRRLRGSPATSEIPVAVLSAYPQRDYAGGDVSLPKPVDEAMLVQTVRGLIHGGRIKGRKCILIPNPKPHGNMLMISEGKLRHVSQSEIAAQFKNKFGGTVFLSGDSENFAGLEKLAGLDDVLLLIAPEKK